MSWEKVNLEDVCTIIAGQSPDSKYYNQNGYGIPFYQGKADFGINNPKVRYYCTLPSKIAQPKDILLSVRAPVGPTNICETEACIGRGLAAIRSTEKVDHRYVYFFFKSIEKKLADSANGSTFSAITSKDVRNIKIPLPPLHIQKQIADILDKADALHQKDQLLLKKYDELAQSIFYDMFGDPVKNERGWTIKKLCEFGKVKTGNTPPRINPNYYGNHIEWIKTDNIKFHSLHPNKASEFLSIEGERIGRTVDSGSILITCIAGSVSSIGNCVLTNRRVAFNQQINSFTPRVDMDECFIYFLFKYSKKIIQDAATKGMKRIITKSNFEKLEMILPPYDLQIKFSKRMLVNTELRDMQIVSELKSKLLYNALMNNYFN